MSTEAAADDTLNELKCVLAARKAGELLLTTLYPSVTFEKVAVNIEWALKKVPRLGDTVIGGKSVVTWVEDNFEAYEEEKKKRLDAVQSKRIHCKKLMHQ